MKTISECNQLQTLNSFIFWTLSFFSYFYERIVSQYPLKLLGNQLKWFKQPDEMYKE